MTKRTLNKAQRLVIERDLRDLGLLEGRSYHQIARAFGVNASQILRDFRDLDELEVESGEIIRRLLAEDARREPGVNEKFKAAREAAGLSKSELAQAAGVNKSSIGQYEELGVVPRDPKRREKIEEILGQKIWSD